MGRLWVMCAVFVWGVGCAATPCERAQALTAQCKLPAQETDVEGLEVCEASSARAAQCALDHPDAYCAFVEAPGEAGEDNAYVRCLQ